MMYVPAKPMQTPVPDLDIPEFLTWEWFRDLGACPEATGILRRMWPEGEYRTRKNWERAFERRRFLPIINWMCSRFIELRNAFNREASRIDVPYPAINDPRMVEWFINAVSIKEEPCPVKQPNTTRSRTSSAAKRSTATATATAASSSTGGSSTSTHRRARTSAVATLTGSGTTRRATKSSSARVVGRRTSTKPATSSTPAKKSAQKKSTRSGSGGQRLTRLPV